MLYSLLYTQLVIGYYIGNGKDVCIWVTTHGTMASTLSQEEIADLIEGTEWTPKRAEELYDEFYQRGRNNAVREMAEEELRTYAMTATRWEMKTSVDIADPLEY